METTLLYSVWNSSTKKMQFIPYERTHVLNKSVFNVRKPYGKDIIGNTIYEGDFVLFLHHDYLPLINQSCYMVKQGKPVNSNHSKEIPEDELWNNTLVIGNVYEGFTCKVEIIKQHRINFTNIPNKTISNNSEEINKLSPQEKIDRNICPDCNSMLIRSNACKSCTCGFSVCNL